MNDAELLASIAQLEALIRETSMLAGADIADVRKRALELRRRIAMQCSVVSTIAYGVFSAVEHRAAFASEYSRLQSATALHQASWPVVAIEHGDLDYLTSCAAQREAYFRFTKWVRTTLNSPATWKSGAALGS